MQFIDKKLSNIISWIESEVGVEFIATSIYRDGDQGVHGQVPVRGIDLRMRNHQVGFAIADLINSSWVYDTERPKMKCCLLHGTGSNMHLHVQVHPRTEKL